MFKITMGKKTFDVAAVMRSSEYSRGAQREIIMLYFRTAEVAYEDIHAVVTDPAALKKMSTSYQNGGDEATLTTTQFEDFIVPGEPVISVVNEVVDSTVSSVAEELFLVKLGKLTYIEEQLQRLGVNPLG